MELNPWLDLLNTEFMIIENGLFCGETTGSENMQISGFHWQDGEVYLIEETSCFAEEWKNFKYSKSFIELLNFLPEGLLSNFKTR